MLLRSALLPDVLRNALLASLLALTVACGSDDAPDPPGEHLRSSVDRLSASTDLSEVRALTDNNTAFALALHAELPSGENLFYSPHSISTALAMTYAGAAGETAQEMRETLRFAQTPEVLHQAFNTLDQQLESRGRGQRGVDGTPFRLRVVNALFAQRGFAIRDPYLDDMARYYDAGVSLLDFVTETEPSRMAINRWVADVTEGRIDELVPLGAVTPDTVLVLTNAVYFNAAWKSPFPEGSTQAGAFERLDGTSVEVPLMRGQVASAVNSGEGWLAAEIPYAGDEVSMVLVVPEDLEAFEARLDAALLAEIVDGLVGADVAVTMPRFEMRSKLSLKDVLSAMGMAGAFELADFSALTPETGLAISDVLHEGFVKVNEEGTEAAAATAVIVGRVSLPQEIAATRPFLFLIRDVETGAVLFVGRVVDPTI